VLPPLLRMVTLPQASSLLLFLAILARQGEIAWIYEFSEWCKLA